jgi:hypothetical protein
MKNNNNNKIFFFSILKLNIWISQKKLFENLIKIINYRRLSNAIFLTNFILSSQVFWILWPYLIAHNFQRFWEHKIKFSGKERLYFFFNLWFLNIFKNSFFLENLNYKSHKMKKFVSLKVLFEHAWITKHSWWIFFDFFWINWIFLHLWNFLHFWNFSAFFELNAHFCITKH